MLRRLRRGKDSDSDVTHTIRYLYVLAYKKGASRRSMSPMPFSRALINSMYSNREYMLSEKLLMKLYDLFGSTYLRPAAAILIMFFDREISAAAAADN